MFLFECGETSGRVGTPRQKKRIGVALERRSSKAYATAERWRILEPLRKAVNLQRGEARRREVLPVRNRVSARIAYEHMTLSGRRFLWLIAASGAGYVHLRIGAAAKQA